MAAVDYFLVLDGVKGETEDKAFKDKGGISLESWSWGESQQGTFSSGGGGGAGKVVMQDFHFVKKVDKATADLMLRCANGEHIKKADLYCRKAGAKQEIFFTVKLKDVIVSSFQTGGSGHGDIIPTEQISFNFAEIEAEYFVQDAKGQVASGGKMKWNQKQNIGGK